MRDADDAAGVAVGEAEYRASLVKAALKDYESRSDPVFAEILDRIGPETLTHIRRASRLDWLPAELFDRFNGASLEVWGDDGYVAFWEEHTKAIIKLPLFGAIAKGALSIFGVQPPTLLKFVAMGWERTTRNYGRVESTIEEHRCALSLVELPEEGRLRTVGLSMKASLVALIGLAGCEGHCLMDEARLGEGRLDFEATWTRVLLPP